MPVGTTKLPIRIVVLQRSWNLIGRYEESPDGKTFTIHDPCYVIRRWGTVAGLGELAMEGPLKKSDRETILDKTPTVQGHMDALIYTMDVNQDKWEGTSLF